MTLNLEMLLYIKASYWVEAIWMLVLNSCFSLDCDFDALLLMSAGCWGVYQQLCSLHLLWIGLWILPSLNRQPAATFAGEAVRCALHLDWLLTAVSFTPTPLLRLSVCVWMCVRGVVVCTCAQTGGGLRGGGMWNRRRAISDRWWDCAYDPVCVGSAVLGGEKEREEEGRHLCFRPAMCWTHVGLDSGNTEDFSKQACWLRTRPGPTCSLHN